jgi:hypothetical protein
VYTALLETENWRSESLPLMHRNCNLHKPIKPSLPHPAKL